MGFEAHNRQSPFEVQLLHGTKQWAVFLCACVLVFCVQIGREYSAYSDYISPEETQEIYAQVIAQYTKTNHKGKYEVLKLKSAKGEIFYTTSKEDLRDLTHRFVRIYGKRSKCDFKQYLRSCFFVSFRISLLSTRDYRDNVREFIAMQHQDEILARFYQTLFIADILPFEFRDISNKLGIAHLLAISGFHLGILSFVIGGILSLFYTRLHHKFSYRNKVYDISAIVLVCMFFYLIVLDFSPSFLRSFVMAAFGFYVVYSGVKLISFRLLFVVVCVCMALFPRLIYSIGFALSVAGVFYIYLFVRHIRFLPKQWYKKVALGLWFNAIIFLNMLPLVHWFFPYFTPLGLLSIIITLSFIVYFPLVLGLHAIGLGFVFDSFLLWAKSLDINAISFYTPLWILLPFVILCFWAIKSRLAYVCVNIFSFMFFVFLSLKFYTEGASLW